MIVSSDTRSLLMRSIVIAFAALAGFYLLQLLALMIRFQDIPNYINFYDWFENVIHVFRSTPSWRDSFMIIQEEWWLEVGYLNTDFGLGISEWSLYLAPFKMLVMYAVLFLIVLNAQLLMRRKKLCNKKHIKTGVGVKGLFVANGFGAALTAVTSITMSWVVCCATPTWIVGLAMLGLGVTTSLQLEPVGIWLYLAGIALLVMVAVLQVQWFFQQGASRKAAS